MKKEDQSSILFAQSSKLGKPVFFRYSLSVNKENVLNREDLLNEIFNWLGSFGEFKLKRLLATYSENKEVLLISMTLDESIMANIFLDFSYKRKGFIKKFEIAGSQGMYVFDSTNTQGFDSDCCEIAEYETTSANQKYSNWLSLVQESLQKKQVVYCTKEEQK